MCVTSLPDESSIIKKLGKTTFCLLCGDIVSYYVSSEEFLILLMSLFIAGIKLSRAFPLNTWLDVNKWTRHIQAWAQKTWWGVPCGSVCMWIIWFIHPISSSCYVLYWYFQIPPHRLSSMVQSMPEAHCFSDYPTCPFCVHYILVNRVMFSILFKNSNVAIVCIVLDFSLQVDKFASYKKITMT